MGLPAEVDDEDGGDQAEDHNTVGEDQPVPPVGELPGQKAVAAENGRKPREIGEAGVCGQNQDQHRGRLDDVVKDTVAENAVGDLGHYGLGLARGYPQYMGQKADTQEHADGQDRHVDQGFGGVLGDGLVERLDAVGNGLHPGEGRAPSGERAQDEEGGERRQGPCRGRRCRRRGKAAQDPPGDAYGVHHQDAGDEEIGGDGEDIARLPHSPQVSDDQEKDRQKAQSDPVSVKSRHSRGYGGDARRNGNGHGEDVVDEQSGARRETGDKAEVVLGYNVRSSARRVGENRLAVGKGDSKEEQCNGEGDRQAQGKGSETGQDQGPEDFLRGVGDRGQSVGRKDRQSLSVGQTFNRDAFSGQRLARLPRRPGPSRPGTAGLRAVGLGTGAGGVRGRPGAAWEIRDVGLVRRLDFLAVAPLKS